eukprot:1119953-Pleurochrysis_carterae.AAC.1
MRHLVRSFEKIEQLSCSTKGTPVCQPHRRLLLVPSPVLHARRHVSRGFALDDLRQHTLSGVGCAARARCDDKLVVAAAAAQPTRLKPNVQTSKLLKKGAKSSARVSAELAVVNQQQHDRAL